VVLVQATREKLLPSGCVEILCDPAYYFHCFSLASDWGDLATLLWFFAADETYRRRLAVFWHCCVRSGVDVASVMATSYLASSKGSVLLRGLELALPKDM
jgi:hypothetical protein